MQSQSQDPDDTMPGLRARILGASAELISAGGLEAATTRAVAAAAGVQAPTIYRLFGDKLGLMDAVAEHVLASYVMAKANLIPHPDPVQDLRDGWDMHIAFGTANPDLMPIMYEGPRRRSPAAALGKDVLRGRVRAVALAGRLRVSEGRAMTLLQAAGVGTLLTLIAQPLAERDAGLSEAAREAVIAAICTDKPAFTVAGPKAAASALSAALDQATMLSQGELLLLREWLGRIADGP